jgi:hypothetical protein
MLDRMDAWAGLYRGASESARARLEHAFPFMRNAEGNFIHSFGWILPGRRLDSGGVPNLKMLQDQRGHKVIHWDLPGILID